MPADSSPASPIYNSLIEEHGDVLAEVRETAQALQQEAEQALDFSPVHSRHPDTGRPQEPAPDPTPPPTPPAPAPAPAPAASAPSPAPDAAPAAPPAGPQERPRRPRPLGQRAQPEQQHTVPSPKDSHQG
ncbi:hypothetical protein MMF93_18355 [Streptomyces tubbatahanensis]|uniref:Uncharacterized protein n=1 Tax=Streptomyces tubbatahanensis TaxID=2923272 RepID=A0ABY3Y3H5_9ACTN|nr:hypothetical protein [Streptomyces tubbatahanensis]UNT01398.1 hypothetical protein MMF93_18355 [Streptomyces tubbatahanensis]